MNKNQIALIAAGAVSAVVVIGVSALTFTKLGESSKLSSDTKRAFRSLQENFNKDPFPSEANLDIARDNRKSAEAWVKQLKAAFAKGEITTKSGLTPGEFNRRREEAITELVEKAPKNAANLPVVDEKFLFGFDRFSSGVPAEKADVPRLVRQLELTKLLTQMLYDSNIQSLKAVARVEFDAGEAAAADSGRSSRRTARGGRRSSDAKVVQSLRITNPDISSYPVELSVERFGFRFTTLEAGLIAFINKIDAMRPFAKISYLAIDNTEDAFVFPDEVVAKKESSSRKKKDEPVAAPAPVNEKPIPRAARMVSGPHREKPVEVTIYVDVYSMVNPRMATVKSTSEEEL